jgi:7-cyano-7-deazaguanine synthase
MSERERAVVCLSGGMDSCVCAAMAAQTHEIYTLHFSYGQRTEARELASARAVADRLGAKKFLSLHMDLFRQIGGSALVDDTIDVPRATDATGKISERPAAEIPATYVPFRNAHFLSAAVSWAELLGAGKVYIGAVEQDSSGYPDCRPAFYTAFQQAVDWGTKAGGIEMVTPLIALRKSEIVKRGIALKAPLDLTWSCYTNEQQACGVCESCVLRLEAFAQAGISDPVAYTKGQEQQGSAGFPRRENKT